MSIAALEYLVL